jgi:hypothetical protein
MTTEQEPAAAATELAMRASRDLLELAQYAQQRAAMVDPEMPEGRLTLIRHYCSLAWDALYGANTAIANHFEGDDDFEA